MQVDRQHTVGIDGGEHLGSDLGGDRHARRARASILPGIAEIRYDGGDDRCRRTLQRIDQHQQFHEIFSRGRGRRLDDEHVLATHVFLDLDLDFAVGKLAHQRLAHGHAEFAADRLCKRPVGVATENKKIVVAHVRLLVLSLFHCNDGWGGRIRTYEMPGSKPGALGHLATPQHSIKRIDSTANTARLGQGIKQGRVLNSRNHPGLQRGRQFRLRLLRFKFRVETDKTTASGTGQASLSVLRQR